MQKNYVLCIIFFLQTSLLFSCSQAGEPQRVHIDDHLATIAALMACAEPLNLSTQSLYKPPIARLTRALTTKEKCWALFCSEEENFSIFLTPHAEKDELREKESVALQKILYKTPVATFYTHTTEHDGHDTTIVSSHNIDGYRSEVVISHLTAEGQTLTITTTPKPPRSPFTYQLGSTNKGTMPLPLPAYPDHEIFVAAYPQEDPLKKFVECWALPPKKAELK